MGTPTAAIRTQSKPVSGRLRGGDEVAWAVTFLFALIILAVTVLLVYELWSASAPSREKFGFGFLTSTLWNPVTDEFGALPYIYGTVLTSLLASLRHRSSPTGSHSWSNCWRRYQASSSA
jgi:ABC-type phosphate transport system permease subunit